MKILKNIVFLLSFLLLADNPSISFADYNGPPLSGVGITTVGSVINLNSPVLTTNGGTGQTSYTDGQLLIGNTSTGGLSKAALTGTANQAIVTNGNGTITLSAPQDIGTTSNPMFAQITVSGDPTMALQLVTKQYADAISGGLVPKTPDAVCSTTANLNATYSNGASGVGATLTNAGTQAAFTCDGVSPSSTNVVLVQFQTTQANNGIYTLTTVGTGATNWVLTRATNFNQASNITQNAYINVSGGSTLPGTYIETGSGPFVVGTTAITFSAFNQINVGNGLTKSGNTVSANINGTNLQFTSTAINTIQDIATTSSPTFLKLTSTQTTGTAPFTVASTTVVSNLNADFLSGQHGSFYQSGSNINAGLVGSTYGGTGVNNGASTITLGGNLTTSGAFATTFTMTAGTSVTFPTSGTLATTAQIPNFAVREVPSGLINSSNVTYTLAHTPISGSEEVFLNGVLQNSGAGNDYTISTSTITYLSAPLTGSTLLVSYRY